MGVQHEPTAPHTLPSDLLLTIMASSHAVQGSVLASDAFFPFSWNDSVEIACQVGWVPGSTQMYHSWLLQLARLARNTVGASLG